MPFGFDDKHAPTDTDTRTFTHIHTHRHTDTNAQIPKTIAEFGFYLRTSRLAAVLLRILLFFFLAYYYELKRKVNTGFTGSFAENGEKYDTLALYLSSAVRFSKTACEVRKVDLLPVQKKL